MERLAKRAKATVASLMVAVLLLLLGSSVERCGRAG
jgi:hypothetical protein